MKRFCDTETLTDPWVRHLSLEGKLVYWWLKDKCDAAGVWEPDRALVNFVFQRDIEWTAVQSELTEPFNSDLPRVEILKNGKWFLTHFIAFQYGKLSKECFPHRKIMELVVKHGLEKHRALVGLVTSALPTRVGSRVVKPKQLTTTLPPPLLGSDPTTQQDKDKDKDKDKEGIGGVEGRVNGQRVELSLEEQIYDAYPRHTAKQDALKAIKKALDTFPLWRDTMLAKVTEYAAAVAKWPEDEKQYIPHPSTWFNQGCFEDDPKTWERKSNANHHASSSRGFESAHLYEGVNEK